MEPALPDPDTARLAATAPFPAYDGEMAELIHAYPWETTPLGPIERWSSTLRTMVGFLLANRFPLLLWWGPQYIQVYNDAYRPILGQKHPERSLGRSVWECWDEIWHILRPLIDLPFRGGPATWIEDFELALHRTDFIEEAHFTVAYSPVPDAAAPRGIGGVLATVHEITDRIISERRVALLRDLGTKLSAELGASRTACEAAAGVLQEHPKDIPFALLYLRDGGSTARLAGSTGETTRRCVGPSEISLEDERAVWPLARALHEGGPVLVDDLSTRFAAVPPGPWKDAPQQAVIVPIPSGRSLEPVGLLVAGLSARLRWNEGYRGWLELIAALIGAAIAKERALIEERRRAAALAALDRAKTTFFSNVSHELRTPLTLMLAPLEDELREGGTRGTTRDRLELVHRNALRLLKLVNMLLDFSGIEGGRIEAHQEPTDLARLTADVASSFRAAVERAGLELVVDCPDLRPVRVDREMWEKIVLNLLSNALKFTFAGRIEVRLRREGEMVVLRVADTGVGIPAEHRKRVFERFHRIPEQRGRTHEGTGIGLALVAELVALHGGRTWLESEEGVGSRFYVALPAAAPSETPEPADASRPRLRADLFTLEFEPSSRPAGALTPVVPDGLASERILVADDNADMREYLARLLHEQGYRVEAVEDGQAALRSARRARPALILTDVMMPRVDGLGLLRAIRDDLALAEIPVVVVSARAGHDEQVTGLDGGADDYVVKPFTARELLARIRAQLRFARLRREAAAKAEASAALLQEVADGASELIFVKDLRGHLIFANRETKRVIGEVDLPSRILREGEQASPLAAELALIDANDQRVFRTGHALVVDEVFTGADGTRTYRATKSPLRDAHGVVRGLIGISRDVTDQLAAEEQLRASEEFNRTLMDASVDCVKLLDREGRILRMNEAGQQLFEIDDVSRVHGQPWPGMWPVEEMPRVQAALARAQAGETAAFVGFCPTARGTPKWWDVRISPVAAGAGGIARLLSVSRDVTEHRQAQEALHQASQRKDEFLAMLAHELRNPLSSVVNAATLLREQSQAGEQRWAAGVITRQSAQLARLVDDLLDVSRISRGQIVLRKEPVDVARALRGACEAVAPLVAERQHTLTTDFPSGELWVEADPTRLEQIVGNLLANSARYTPPQGRIRLSARREGGEVCIEVTDNGIGLNPARIPEMFELFVQGERDSARSDGGLGIGLTVVRALSELHGGSVGARSGGPGEGATFVVRLPAIASPAHTPLPRPIVPSAGEAGPAELRLLIVDDNLDAADGLGRLMVRRGYTVHLAYDGLSALAAAASFSPHAVLLDLGLPDVDGWEVCRRLRAAPTTAQTVVVALSGYGQREDRSRSRDVGFDQHLVKPVDLPELTDYLQRTIARRFPTGPGSINSASPAGG
ncbi:MAG: response regulator [Verrucomicrobia bacterium]|nr:response regulator [Verrucomicrobiota bacterium]